MGSTFLQMAKEARKLRFNTTKAFKMVSDRVMQILGEKVDEKKTFEPPKKPVDNEMSRALGSAHLIWLPK